MSTDGRPTSRELLKKLTSLRQTKAELERDYAQLKQLEQHHKAQLSKVRALEERASRQLVDELELFHDEPNTQYQTDTKVKHAMKRINRAKFCPGEEKFSLRPCRLTAPGEVDGQGATLSAPGIHAQALRLIAQRWKSTGYRPNARSTVLDVGSGSGYLALALSNLMGNVGTVVGIEYIPDLARWSEQQVNSERPDLLESQHIVLKHGDGWKGDPSYAPYAAIHVGAAAKTIPQALINQLAPNGRMVIPVGEQGSTQRYLVIDKDANGIVQKPKDMGGVMFVPLVEQ